MALQNKYDPLGVHLPRLVVHPSALMGVAQSIRLQNEKLLQDHYKLLFASDGIHFLVLLSDERVLTIQRRLYQ